MGFRRAVGQQFLGQQLPREGRRLGGQRLGCRRHLAGHHAGRIAAVLNREQRLAVGPVEQIHPALFGCLGDGIHSLAVALHGDQAGRRRKIAVPQIVPDALEMPDSLAGCGVQGQQRVGEQIVSHAIGPIKVGGRRAGRNINDAALAVQRHAGPVVGGAGVSPGILRPCVVAEFAGMRNGMERPAERPAADIVGANVPGRRRQGFGLPSANDQKVPINDSRSGQDDGLPLGIAPQVLAKIDPAILAKTRNRFAGRCVERVDIALDRRKQASFLARGPVDHPSVGAAPRDSGIESPEQLSGGGVQCHHLMSGCHSEEDAVHDDWLGLRIAWPVGCVVRPGHLQFTHVGAVDPLERGVPDVRRASAVCRPVSARRSPRTWNPAARHRRRTKRNLPQSQPGAGSSSCAFYHSRAPRCFGPEPRLGAATRSRDRKGAEAWPRAASVLSATSR